MTTRRAWLPYLLFLLVVLLGVPFARCTTQWSQRAVQADATSPAAPDPGTGPAPAATATHAADTDTRPTGTTAASGAAQEEAPADTPPAAGEPPAPGEAAGETPAAAPAAAASAPAPPDGDSPPAARRGAEPAGEPGAGASTAGQRLSGLETLATQVERQDVPATPADLVLPGVEFRTASAELTPASHAVLDEVARILQRHPRLRVEIAGHTDSRGDAARNQALSQARAEAVRDYLVRRGVAADRLVARGYGASAPRADNRTAAGRQKNRRVELRLLP